MTFDYNTTRKKLILAEYGRNVQNMVAYICSLPTKEERNRHAQVVIDLMGFLNPHLRDVTDFKHKLWDHLHIISDFKIDVDSPYPIPSEATLHLKPEPLGYPQRPIRFKHYGKTVEMMIKKARAVDDPVRQQPMIQAIASFMKVAYVTWNKDTVADETIVNDLKELSNGELILDENYTLARVEVRTNAPGVRQKPGSGSGSSSGMNKGRSINGPRNNSNNNSRLKSNNNGKRK